MKLIVFKTILLLGVLITPLILNTINQYQNNNIFCDFNAEEEEKSESENNENELEDFIINLKLNTYFSKSKSVPFNQEYSLFTSIFKEIVLPPPKLV